MLLTSNSLFREWRTRIGRVAQTDLKGNEEERFFWERAS